MLETFSSVAHKSVLINLNSHTIAISVITRKYIQQTQIRTLGKHRHYNMPTTLKGYNIIMYDIILIIILYNVVYRAVLILLSYIQ